MLVVCHSSADFNFHISGLVMDCFVPSSILLGPVDNPIKPRNQCSLTNIANDDDDIKGCLCTSSLCNLGKTRSKELKQSRTKTNEPSQQKRIPTSGNKVIFLIMHGIVFQIILARTFTAPVL